MCIYLSIKLQPLKKIVVLTGCEISFIFVVYAFGNEYKFKCLQFVLLAMIVCCINGNLHVE